eukprot:TRINITY_DN64521_c2_g1_i1.p1 TRINITY_DN64521_c2_g1~~TRINITY_DN64521_c2_g1_i1.p1  ORF type:complete len:312 (+),score=7.79 TRINITY_DN64521_c2_g1_i1:804-1739(+)
MHRFSKETMEWSFNVVTTRIFGTPFGSLVPYHDMFNHADFPNLSREWRSETVLQADLTGLLAEHKKKVDEFHKCDTLFPEVTQYVSEDLEYLKPLFAQYHNIEDFVDSGLVSKMNDLIEKCNELSVCYNVKKGRKILKGEEVTNTYGGYSNVFLAVVYGFALENLHHSYRSCIIIRTTQKYRPYQCRGLHQQARCRQEDCKGERGSLQVPGKFDFQSLLRDTQSWFFANLYKNIDLLLFLRCILTGQKVTTKDPLNIKEELSILEKYREICDTITKEFKTTLDTDQELLAKTKDFKTKALVFYKRIYEQLS